MLKIFSWNVNGLRAMLKKTALQKVCDSEVFTISAAANQNLKPCLQAVNQYITRLRIKPKEQSGEEKPIEPKKWSPLD